MTISTNSFTNLSAVPLNAPGDVAFDPNNGYVYVGTSNQIAVIDGATDHIVAILTLPYATGGGYSLAVDPSNGHVYVEGALYSLYVISGAVIETTIQLGFGHFAGSIAFDQSNGMVYVVDPVHNNVTIISGTTNKVVGVISLDNIHPNNHPGNIIFDPANGYLYVADVNPYFTLVWVINGATNKLLVNVTLSGVGSVLSVLLDPSNGNIYVADEIYSSYLVYLGGFTVIDPADRVIANVTAMPDPFDPASTVFDTANGNLYCIDQRYTLDFNLDYQNIVSVVNTSTNTLVTNLTVFTDPAIAAGEVPAVPPSATLGFDSQNGQVYDMDYYASMVSIIDTTTNVVVKNVTVGSGPVGMAFDPSNGYVYVANGGSNSVSIIDGTTNALVDTIY